ncbi:MAG: SRPBCC domain-containing protein [Thermoanaerobaculia bacterium]|nr:SRPBCC domain-containing protein [Thermoanaerobaculia bacterium]
MRPEAIRQGDIPGVQLRLRRALPLEVEEAWRWLTDPERMERWLGAVAGGGAGELTLTSESASGDPVRERLTTRQRHPPRQWSVALLRLDAGWQAATLLVFELTPAASGCELDVLQTGFQQLALSTCLTEWERYRRRWRRALDRLAAAVGEPGA